MAHDVTIEAAASDGKQYLITFAKTGADKGSVTLKPNDGNPSSYATTSAPRRTIRRSGARPT